MRFLFPVAVVVSLLVLGLVGPAHARGGKGGGGGGGHISRGGGQKSPSGGQGGDWKRQVSQSHEPTKDNVARDKPAKERITKDKATKSAKAKSGADSPGDDGDEAVEANNKKEKQLANFQKQRNKKIAQAEHLRQIAERNGNANLAANADRMETQAHEQYAQKVSHLEKFGVTDPELELNGDGPTSPSVPDTGPLADPLGTLRGLLPFGR
jgi:hypothetical protein